MAEGLTSYVQISLPMLHIIKFVCISIYCVSALSLHIESTDSMMWEIRWLHSYWIIHTTTYLLVYPFSYYTWKFAEMLQSRSDECKCSIYDNTKNVSKTRTSKPLWQCTIHLPYISVFIMELWKKIYTKGVVYRTVLCYLPTLFSCILLSCYPYTSCYIFNVFYYLQ